MVAARLGVGTPSMSRMRLTPRDIIVVVASGVIAVVGVLAYAAGRAGDSPGTDGSFELVKPGEFVEPTGTTGPPVATGDDVLAVEGLVDAEGRPVDLELFRGGPIVINVWFSTCVPCERELRDFADVHARYADSVAFVGIDPFDSSETMLRFAGERGVEYDLWRDPDHAFVNTLGIVSYPTTLFVDADGRVVDQAGVLAGGELESRIEDAFGIPVRE